MDAQLLEKTYVVTGATSGIGFAVAQQLARQGAAVIGVGRSPERCFEAERRLRQMAPQAQIAFCVADLALQSQVRALAEQIWQVLAAWGKDSLDGLLNNAGTFTYWLVLTPEGFETQWAVNHLAPFLLTNALLPLLQAAPAARVVTVSSASHYAGRLDWNDIQLRRRYNGLRAYDRSKLANVLFTAELNHRLGEYSTVRAFAADPGLVKTEIGFKGTPALVRWVWGRRRAAGIAPETSAKGMVYLLTEPSIQDSAQVYWKHSIPQAPSRRAQDAEAARRLWALSEQMCGMVEEQ